MFYFLRYYSSRRFKVLVTYYVTSSCFTHRIKYTWILPRITQGGFSCKQVTVYCGNPHNYLLFRNFFRECALNDKDRFFFVFWAWTVQQITQHSTNSEPCMMHCAMKDRLHTTLWMWGLSVGPAVRAPSEWMYEWIRICIQPQSLIYCLGFFWECALNDKDRFFCSWQTLRSPGLY